MRKIFEDNKNGRVEPETHLLSDDVMFIAGAIRAAKNSPLHIRQKVIMDIVHFMGCHPNELDFLFQPQNDNQNHEYFDLPNSARRRQIIQDNFLDAAE